MFLELCRPVHRRLLSLPLLGPHLDGFVSWLAARGYALSTIRDGIASSARLEDRLRHRGVSRIEDVTYERFLQIGSHGGRVPATFVRSVAKYFESRGLFRAPAPKSLTRAQRLVEDYRVHLVEVRGLAEPTAHGHAFAASELLDFLLVDEDARALRRLKPPAIDGFVRHVAPRLCRASLQAKVGQVRSFLRFLISHGRVADGLDDIDTPRVYRGERLPKALPWTTVQSFLAAIDRSTPMGRRDYAMFLLITTYGLRIGEVAGLRLDDIDWREGRLRVRRPKSDPIVLPLTKEVGAAIIEYLRDGRPEVAHREVFLRVRAPIGPIGHATVEEAFGVWIRRGKLPIPFRGPHCLRHSLAVHLLRKGTSLKAIGDLLGHRSAEATCVYLRLHVDDLRDVSLEVPTEVRP
jgi:integrase